MSVRTYFLHVFMVEHSPGIYTYIE